MPGLRVVFLQRCAAPPIELFGVLRFFTPVWRVKKLTDWVCDWDPLTGANPAGFGFFPGRGPGNFWVRKTTHPPELFCLGARSGGPTHIPRFAWSGKAARDVLGFSLLPRQFAAAALAAPTSTRSRRSPRSGSGRSWRSSRELPWQEREAEHVAGRFARPSKTRKVGGSSAPRARWCEGVWPQGRVPRSVPRSWIAI